MEPWKFLLILLALSFGGIFVLVAATIAERREKKKRDRDAR